MVRLAFPLLIAFLSPATADPGFPLDAAQDANPGDLAARLRRKLREGRWNLDLLEECEKLLESTELRRELLVAAWDRAKGTAEDDPPHLLFRARMVRPISAPLDFAADLEALTRRFPDDPPILFHL